MRLTCGQPTHHGPNTSRGRKARQRQAGSAAALFGVARYVLGALAAPLTGIIGGDSTLALGIVMIVLSIGGLAAALLAPKHVHAPAH